MRSSICKQRMLIRSFFTSGIQHSACCSLYQYLRQLKQYKQKSCLIYSWLHLKPVIISRKVSQWNPVYNQDTPHMGQCSQSFTHIQQPVAPVTGINSISHQGNESFRLKSFSAHSSECTLAFGLRQLDLSRLQGTLNFIILKFTGITVI